MNANIKDGILYNGNPDFNSAAKPLFSLGKVEVGDTIYYYSYECVVTETEVRVRSEEGKLYKHAIRVKSVGTGSEFRLTNEKEDSDFSGIWE